MSLLSNGSSKYSLKQYRLSEIRQKVEELAINLRSNKRPSNHDLFTSPHSFESTLFPSGNVSILKNMSLFSSYTSSELCYCKKCAREVTREITLDKSFENEFRIRTPPKQYGKEISTEFTDIDSKAKYFSVSPRFSDIHPQSFETRDKLTEFLEELDIEEFGSVFKENRISYEDLRLLCKEDLAELKIPVGPRNRILNALGKINCIDGKDEPDTIEKYTKVGTESPACSQTDSNPFVSNLSGVRRSPLKVLNSKSPSPAQETSRGRLKGEVESFIWELKSMCNRKRTDSQEASRSVDIERTSTFDTNTARSSLYGNVSNMLKDVCSQQDEMMKVIHSNQQEIQSLRKNQSNTSLSKPATPKLARNISVTRKRNLSPIGK